jgi:transcriptional regulator with XRE-family HTH domain
MPQADTGPVQNLRPQRRAGSFDPHVASIFGRIVRRERLRLRLAQDRFALEATIDRSYFGKLERGERQPSLAVLLKIANALGISGAELLAAVEAEIATPETEVLHNEQNGK